MLSLNKYYPTKPSTISRGSRRHSRARSKKASNGALTGTTTSAAIVAARLPSLSLFDVAINATTSQRGSVWWSRTYSFAPFGNYG